MTLSDDPAMSDNSIIDPEAVRAALIAHRKELLRLVESSAEARRTVELDQSRVGRLSRMDALQSQAMSVETDRRRKVELRQIEAALGRIDDGDYGFCVGCGEAIAPKRLALNPTTPICIECAQSAGR
jgi:DnaK suppressor protein